MDSRLLLPEPLYIIDHDTPDKSFGPVGCEIVDFTHYQDGRIKHERQNLQPGQLGPWLTAKANDAINRNENIILRSRLVYFEPRSFQCPRPLPLPFSKLEMATVIEHLGVPERHWIDYLSNQYFAGSMVWDDGSAWFIHDFYGNAIAMRRREGRSLTTIISGIEPFQSGAYGSKHSERRDAVSRSIRSKSLSAHPFYAITSYLDFLQDFHDTMSHRMLSGLSAKESAIYDRPKPPNWPRSDNISPVPFELDEFLTATLVDEKRKMSWHIQTSAAFHESVRVLKAAHADYQATVCRATADPPQLVPHGMQLCSVIDSMLSYQLGKSEATCMRNQTTASVLQHNMQVAQLRLSERDTKASLELGRNSAMLAAAAKRDSSSMKVIAVLTTVFLPGTFIATLLSVPGYDQWTADAPWRYWAVTIPLTLTITLALLLWMWRMQEISIRDEMKAIAKGQKDS